jgi:hypothetical protein
MSKKLTGKSREELIRKWLKGEEDALWQVKPTKTEGKYIISPRQQSEPEQGQEQPLKEEKQEEEEEPEPPQKVAPIPQKVASIPQKVKPNRHALSQDVSQEILNQLLLLGEERREKQKRKEQKKEIKKQLMKQLGPPTPYYAPMPEPEPPQEEELQPDEEVFEYHPPPMFYLPQRRRVNLNIPRQ